MPDMTPADVPQDLLDAAMEAPWDLSFPDETARAILAAVLPLHEQQVREKATAGFETQWGVRRRGFMNRLFPKIAIDYMGSEVEARHEAANPSRPGIVVARLVGEWRDADA